MKIKELIRELSKFDQEATVMIWGTDGCMADEKQVDICKGNCDNYWFIAPVCHIHTSTPNAVIEQCKDEKNIVFLETQ